MKKNKFIVLQHLGWATLACALFFRMAGYNAYFLYATNAFTSPARLKKLAALGIVHISFETDTPIDAGTYLVQKNFGQKVLEESGITSTFFANFQPLFGDIEGLSQKLATAIRSQIADELWDVNKLICWIDANIPAKATCLLLCTSSPFIRHAYSIANKNLRVIPVGAPHLVRKILKPLATIACQKLQSLLRLKKKLHAPSAEQGNSTNDFSRFDILFFPHKTIFYGDLFIKDHFYADSPTSPFHRTKILHVEHVKISESEQIKMASYCNQYKIPFCNMPYISNKQLLSSSLKTIFLAFSIFLSIKKNNLKHGLYATINIIAFAIRFNHFKMSLKRFSNAKIALIGYDFLFSKPLSLALQASNIKIVASQERYSLLYYPNSTMICDYYFTAGPLAEHILKNNQYASVDNKIATGLVRSDKILEYKNTDNSFTSHTRNIKNKHFLILALDYHSTDNEFHNDTEPLTNWKANSVFYRDIIKLANDISNTYIIIRSKNDTWTKIPALADEYRTILNHPRIEFNNSYEIGAAYKIASASDLIIAKYTSLGDESLAAGIPTLFHDYQHNTNAVFQRVFNFFDFPLYAKNYNDLYGKVLKIMDKRGEFFSPAFSDLQYRMFGGSADGKAKERILKHLEDIYKLVTNGKHTTPVSHSEK